MLAIIVILAIAGCTGSRKIHQENFQEIIKLSSLSCDPSKQDCTTINTTSSSITSPNTEECDDASPSNDFSCEFYASSNFCDQLDDQFCKQSCGRCCQDLQVSQISCDFILQSQSCYNDNIRNNNYCEKTCGICDASITPAPAPAPTPALQPEPVVTSSTAEILLQFRQKMLNSNGRLTDWSGTDPCNNWSFIKCQSGQIKEIKLEDVNVGTSIPAEFSLFEQLEMLQMVDVNLTGTLMAEFSAWQQIKFVELDSNQISGSIPKEYSSWKSIQFVEFANNRLTGTIAPELSSWEMLNYLYFSTNKLSGTVSPQFSTWKKIAEVFLSSNQLTGTIPQQISTWNLSKRVWFSTNQLTGSMSQEFSEWTVVEEISVSSNFLTGTLPPEFTLWKISEGLDFSQNNFVGSLPIEYSELLKNRPNYLTFFPQRRQGLCVEFLPNEDFLQVSQGLEVCQ